MATVPFWQPYSRAHPRIASIYMHWNQEVFTISLSFFLSRHEERPKVVHIAECGQRRRACAESTGSFWETCRSVIVTVQFKPHPRFCRPLEALKPDRRSIGIPGCSLRHIKLRAHPSLSANSYSCKERLQQRDRT